MIDEHIDSKCRIFLCYRDSGAETAKMFKNYLKGLKNVNFGRIWYSDDESVGNFKLNILNIIPQCDYYVLFVTSDFTKGFLTPSGENNQNGYSIDDTDYKECITMQEIIAIEKQRQQRPVTIIVVNIDGSTLDTSIFEKVFSNAGILCDDSVEFYQNLNQNVYLRRQTDFELFASRISKGLELNDMIGLNFPKESNENTSNDTSEIHIIDEHKYQEAFSRLIKSGNYPFVDFFGYTGQVLSSDLLNYSDRYSLDLTLRILQRNYVIEAEDEKRHNQKIGLSGIRPWEKAESIKKMCYEEWPYSMKRIIKYYSHQPMLKGTLFCNANKRAVIGFFNFQKWEEFPLSGGSEFKSVPSDMIFVDGRSNKKNEILLERLQSQFEYEWAHAISQSDMKNYTGISKPRKLEKPEIIITDFDRTLIYFYKDVSLLLQLAKIISDYYSLYIDVDDSYYMKDGYNSWHELHQKVDDEYSQEQSYEINSKAEMLVTKFEMETEEKVPLFENVDQTIKLLYTNGIKLAIVSSNSSDVIKKTLSKYKLDTYFDCIFGREIPFNPFHLKPSPYQLNMCIAKMGVKGKRIWYTGDDIVDMKAAKKAGVIAIGIASGRYSEQALFDAGDDYCFKSFNDLTKYLDIDCK